jgi:hypothetical protein
MKTMNKPEILAKAHEYQRKVSASLMQAQVVPGRTKILEG